MHNPTIDNPQSQHRSYNHKKEIRVGKYIIGLNFDIGNPKKVGSNTVSMKKDKLKVSDFSVRQGRKPPPM